MISQTELDRFYEDLVSTVRANGGVCAITSGMACVEYGVAQSTKDCDVLCTAESLQGLFDVLTVTNFCGACCVYRGNISPPLDARWLRGGWTSHFVWKRDEAEAYLDVFCVAPRGSTRWEQELVGLYAHPHTVAEMKRTDRIKDWPFTTALGTRMLEAGDARGWLHLFDEDVLRQMVGQRDCPDEIRRRRPILQLAFDRDKRLGPALRNEMHFWHELDRARIRIHEQAVRPYLSAVRKEQLRNETNLTLQHTIRLKCAEDFLVINPVADFGIDRLIADAIDGVRQSSGETWLSWLPDVRENFEELAR